MKITHVHFASFIFYDNQFIFYDNQFIFYDNQFIFYFFYDKNFAKLKPLHGLKKLRRKVPLFAG